jgi:hypothetical protein
MIEKARRISTPVTDRASRISAPVIGIARKRSTLVIGIARKRSKPVTDRARKRSIPLQKHDRTSSISSSKNQLSSSKSHSNSRSSLNISPGEISKDNILNNIKDLLLKYNINNNDINIILNNIKYHNIETILKFYQTLENYIKNENNSYILMAEKNLDMINDVISQYRDLNCKEIFEKTNLKLEHIISGRKNMDNVKKLKKHLLLKCHPDKCKSDIKFCNDITILINNII